MATPFETDDTILTQEQADHINERHVSITKHPNVEISPNQTTNGSFTSHHLNKSYDEYSESLSSIVV